MALYVNTNVKSLNAQSKLSVSTNNLDVSYQRLSSGLRINTAKDDAANLQISERITSQIQGLDQANRNANDGIALLQTVESAMEEQVELLQKVRTLAVQAANGTNSNADRLALNTEANAYIMENRRIATDTTYGGYKVLYGYQGNGEMLFDNSYENGTIGNKKDAPGHVRLQVGSDHNQTIDIGIKSSYLPVLVRDTLVPVTNKSFADTFKNSLGYHEVPFGNQPPMPELNFSISSAENAQECITAMDALIEVFDGLRNSYGGTLNRLESSIRNQSNVSQQESDARSRMRDTDFASETASLTSNNIMQQASQTILAQANQYPALVNTLLR